MNFKLLTLIVFIISFSCKPPSKETVESKQISSTGNQNDVKLIILDPGHFHSYLVQKRMYDEIDPEVHVYAPRGGDAQEYLNRIEQYNTRKENPTNWEEKVYLEDDFFEKLLEEKKGNVVVLAGNNARKINYIDTLLEAGFNVLADKPVVINPEGFSLLKKAFDTAEEQDVVLYDIMTERYNIFSILQKEFSKMPDLFGELEKGTPEKPAISKASIHHVSKIVSGKPLIRPAWFFDVDQQGEGITDITTHFVDLILWSAFPKGEVPIENTEVVTARRWATEITPKQFQQVTGLEDYPHYLKKDIKNDSVLNLFSNGEFVFKANGVYGKVSVTWNYEAPKGAADSHSSIMRGTKANLVIRQGKAQNYKPVLYVEPLTGNNSSSIEDDLKEAVNQLNEKYPGLTYKPAGNNNWEIVIPDEHKEDHEAHFSRVMEKYLQYVEEGELPDWEKQLMLTKYYLTIQAQKLSRKGLALN
jgi:predicted dehydrogenase